VPELPQTLQLFKAEVKSLIDIDKEIKEYLISSDDYKFTYTDDSNDIIQVSNDKDLMAAYADGLEA